MKLANSLLIAASALAFAGSAYAADDKKDPGFNALDKNDDGYISRLEAAGDADLMKNFKQADKNNDGKISRAEYLAVKAKKDAKAAHRKVEGAAQRADPNNDTGSGKTK